MTTTRNRWAPKLGCFKGTRDQGVGGIHRNSRERVRNPRVYYEFSLCSLGRTWKINRIRDQIKQVTWILARPREASLTHFGEFPSSFLLISLENSFPKAHPGSCMFENILHGHKYVEGSEDSARRRESSETWLWTRILAFLFRVLIFLQNFNIERRAFAVEIISISSWLCCSSPNNPLDFFFLAPLGSQDWNDDKPYSLLPTLAFFFFL